MKTIKEILELFFDTEKGDWKKYENGGGWVHKDAVVHKNVFVGPDAIIRGGEIRGGIIHGGYVYGGEIHGGEIHGGEIHGGTILGGTILGGIIRGGMMIYGGTIHGGTIHGGFVYGGYVYGGEIRGGTIHGGTIHGGTILGGEIYGGEIRGGAVIDGALISIFNVLPWPVLISRHHLHIGCQQRTFAQWRKVSDADLLTLQPDAVRLKKQFGKTIFALCEGRE